MELTDAVGNVALVCTIASSFSGLPICIDFFRKGSTSNASILPFLAGSLCSSLWLFYSIVVENGTLQFVNTVSTFLQTCYVCCFYISTVHKKSTGNKVLGAAIFLFFTYVYAFHVAETAASKIVLGYLSSIFTTLACASPLTSVKDVIRAKSTESLPLPIIFSSFVVSSLWYIYGILVDDNFIQVPNFIGALLGGFQLSLFGLYPSKTKIS